MAEVKVFHRVRWTLKGDFVFEGSLFKVNPFTRNCQETKQKAAGSQSPVFRLQPDVSILANGRTFFFKPACSGLFFGQRLEVNRLRKIRKVFFFLCNHFTDIIVKLLGFFLLDSIAFSKN